MWIGGTLQGKMMKAMNLYLLTRIKSGNSFSMLAGELAGDVHNREYSRHEADSLRALIEALNPVLRDRAVKEGSWIRFLDGFYYSYTIAHVSKEFDLLKISGDGACVLNIELKSETIEEDRISRQLAQNRYYLSHISGTIYSFTYVMETDTLYNLNDKGHMRICSMEDLADVLCRPVFTEYVEKDLDQYFRAADYLISPAAVPGKFLQGNYFLTNQQSEFRRRILETFADCGSESAPVIAVSGSAGTGKSLLLFDLAMALSKKKKVLILHGGRLHQGHKVIDERLKNVFIRTADSYFEGEDWSCVLIDEANRIPDDRIDRILRYVKDRNIPCIMAYDPHHLVDREDAMTQAEERIREAASVSLEFTGNIRINRPVFSFLRNLFHQKERAPVADYSCIDVVFAQNREEAAEILAYYTERGYRKITLPGAGTGIGEGLSEDELVGLEFDCVMVILDNRFYYDEEKHLRAFGNEAEKAINLLYEGISRTREKLCILVLEDEELFTRILAIREQ